MRIQLDTFQTRIDISHNNLGNEGFAIVIKSLAEQGSRLDFFDLTRNCIDTIRPDLIEAIGAQIIDIRNITLDRNEFAKGSYSRLSTLINNMPKLRTIQMRDCLINDQGFALLIQEICTRCVEIEKIDFSNNTLGDRAMEDFAKEIKATRRLQELEVIKLNGNQIQTAGAITMISAIDKPNNVKEIYLSENQIKEDFPELFVQYMRHVRSQNNDYNHKLVKIDLSGNAISLCGSRDIQIQLDMNIRYNTEKKKMKNK